VSGGDLPAPAGILVSLAAQPVPSVATLQSVLATHKPGDRVQARVACDGTQSTVQLSLSNLTS
jgi:S1-C subfamily serine protease